MAAVARLQKLGPSSKLLLRRFASTESTSSAVSTGKITDAVPKPGSTLPSELQFDQKTHTGQAWDQEDYRLVRFTHIPKQVNPNIAMQLIADIPPIAHTEKVVACDGGGGALGHPKIFINLDKPGNHACGYCGLRFYREGQTHDGTEHIQV